MENIITYLKWRGNLSFQQDAFNEVDNLVLSELSYMNFKNLVPALGETGSTTIRDAFLNSTQTEFRPYQKELFEAAASAPRYAGLFLKNYHEVFKTDGEGIQFAALEISLPDGSSYISFRGTDFTIVGWKEDFAMGYKIVPAQKEAAQYLNTVLHAGRYYRLGGHSKGGTLAIYGAMMCDPRLQANILAIYSNDGPGLCDQLIDQERYTHIKDKIIKIVPEFSVIGQLFEKDAPYKIVKSSHFGFMQHDALSWEVEGNMLKAVPSLAKECIFYNNLFDEWMENVSMEDREIFVSDYFAALEASDAISMDELAKKGPQAWEKILVSMKHTDPRAKHTLMQFIKLVWKKVTNVSLRDVVTERKMIPWIALLLIGIFFLSFPLYFGQVLGTAAFLCLFVYSVYQVSIYEKQRKAGGRISGAELLFSLLSILLFLCLINHYVTVLSTNLALAFLFAYRAYIQGKHALHTRLANSRGKLTLYAADAFISSGLCLFSILSNVSVNPDIMLATGSYLILISGVEIGKCMWTNSEKS